MDIVLESSFHYQSFNVFGLIQYLFSVFIIGQTTMVSIARTIFYICSLFPFATFATMSKPILAVSTNNLPFVFYSFYLLRHFIIFIILVEE